MQIKLPYAPGCGHREQAAQVLGQAMQVLGQAMQDLCLSDYVQEIQVTTQADAKRYGMAGSPTILLNGRDIARDGPARLECRTYEGADGGKQGWPDVELVKWALEAGQTPLACCG